MISTYERYIIFTCLSLSFTAITSRRRLIEYKPQGRAARSGLSPMNIAKPLKKPPSTTAHQLHNIRLKTQRISISEEPPDFHYATPRWSGQLGHDFGQILERCHFRKDLSHEDRSRVIMTRRPGSN